MHNLIVAIKAFAETLGGSGLALVAFLDSSFLPLPDVCDVQIAYLTIQHPDRWAYYTLMTAAGSLLGSLVIYTLARKGGEAFLRRRFHERHIDSGLATYRRYGVLTLVMAGLLPPPMPFRILVLLAGVAEVRPLAFVLSLGLARVVRYGADAILAKFYGERVVGFLQNNMGKVGLWTAGAAVLIIASVVLWRRWQASKT